MKILSLLKKASTLLVIVKPMKYAKVISATAKEISGKKVVYITINKTFPSLKELFESNGVDISGFVFIDAITKTIKNTPDFTDGCYFVSSPEALTEMAIAITKVLRHGFDYVVFDSLSNLLTYKDKNSVIRFFSSIIAKVKSNNAKGIFYVLDVGEQDIIIKETATFVDKVIKLGK